MKINYSINHSLMSLPIFDTIKNQERQAVIVMLNCIAHFVRNVGYCDFYKRQMSNDWGINMKAFAKAEKILLNADYIKILRHPSKTDQTPGRYSITKTLQKDAKAYSSVSLKLWSREPKAIVQRATINNVKLFKKDKNLSNDNSHPLIEAPETKKPLTDITTKKNNNRFLQ